MLTGCGLMYASSSSREGKRLAFSRVTGLMKVADEARRCCGGAGGGAADPRWRGTVESLIGAGGWGAEAVRRLPACTFRVECARTGLWHRRLTGKDGSGFGQWLFWASRKNQLGEWTSVLLVQLRICLSVTSTTLYSGSGAMNQSTALAGYVSLRWTGMLMVKGHGSSWNAPTGASSVQLGGVGLEGNLNDVSVWWTAHCDFEGIQMRKWAVWPSEECPRQ